jgi:SAM-dependent methyltransferase
MNSDTKRVTLTLLPKSAYRGVNSFDPIRFYYWPVLGSLYKRRVELCLEQCSGGKRVLEIGFGSGVTFLALNKMYQEIHGLDLTASSAEIASLFRSRGIDTHLSTGDVLDMPFADDYFDTVLLISILEHLRPDQLVTAFREIRRVLKQNGQVVYGVPVERPLMAFFFKVLGYDIRKFHFSTERDVSGAGEQVLDKVGITAMHARPALLGPVYEVGHFTKR